MPTARSLTVRNVNRQTDRYDWKHYLRHIVGRRWLAQLQIHVNRCKFHVFFKHFFVNFLLNYVTAFCINCSFTAFLLPTKAFGSESNFIYWVLRMIRLITCQKISLNTMMLQFCSCTDSDSSLVSNTLWTRLLVFLLCSDSFTFKFPMNTPTKRIEKFIFFVVIYHYPFNSLFSFYRKRNIIAISL